MNLNSSTQVLIRIENQFLFFFNKNTYFFGMDADECLILSKKYDEKIRLLKIKKLFLK